MFVVKAVTPQHRYRREIKKYMDRDGEEVSRRVTYEICYRMILILFCRGVGSIDITGMFWGREWGRRIGRQRRTG